MPFRLASGIQIRVSRGWQAGVTEVQALVDMLINGIQYPRQMIQGWTVQQRLDKGIQEVIYHGYDDRAYNSQGPVETVENQVIHVRHPNLTEKYTIPEVKDHIRKDGKQTFNIQNDKANRIMATLEETEGVQDPDYLAWQQYKTDLGTARTNLTNQFQNLSNAQPATTYDQWVEFGRNWRNVLPSEPEMVSSVSAVQL